MWPRFDTPLLWGVVAFILFAGSDVHAGEADVLSVDVRASADGRFTFAATVAHADAGWDHYADAFEILGPDGQVLATRVLAHPHETEQPFTRSIGGVAVPRDLKTVRVRAHDNVHKSGGAEVSVALPGR